MIPPPPGTTHTGVTVRYLAAEPPLRPVAAGSSATVYVDARHQPYRWALRRAGSKQIVAKGSSSSFTLNVKVPSGRAGMYQLALRSGSRPDGGSDRRQPARRRPPAARTGRPAGAHLAGTEPGRRRRRRLPDTLASGGRSRLNRPLANGFPAGAVDEAGLLAYLDKTHRSYDVTTDVGLLAGFGPTLQGHSGVILAGSELWLPVARWSRHCGHTSRTAGT